MDIPNPRRILAVSLEGSAQHLSRVLKDLTGTAPEPSASSLAGITHDLALKTAYYTASVPIWLDLVSSPADWAASFLSDEAREVLGVLGGLVLVFALPTTAAGDEARELIRSVGRVVKDGLGGWQWDGVGLAIGVGDAPDVEEWDELSAEAGLEFVQLGGKLPDRNEFGEKTGIDRVKEALESNDWAALDDSALSDFGDFEDVEKRSDGDNDKELDPENLDFGFDRTDFEGLKKAIWSSGVENPDSTAEDRKATKESTDKNSTNSSGNEQTPKTADNHAAAALEAEANLDDGDIAKVERMMRKLHAVREAGEGMPPEQRRRLAARAVGEVMKEL